MVLLQNPVASKNKVQSSKWLSSHTPLHLEETGLTFTVPCLALGLSLHFTIAQTPSFHVFPVTPLLALDSGNLALQISSPLSFLLPCSVFCLPLLANLRSQSTTSDKCWCPSTPSEMRNKKGRNKIITRRLLFMLFLESRSLCPQKDSYYFFIHAVMYYGDQ